MSYIGIRMDAAFKIRLNSVCKSLVFVHQLRVAGKIERMCLLSPAYARAHREHRDKNTIFLIFEKENNSVISASSACPMKSLLFHFIGVRE